MHRLGFAFGRGSAGDLESLMQRVRIGLTGLAFVFVLVLLAAIFTRPSEEQPITPKSIEQQRDPGNAAAAVNAVQEAAPAEALAEIGVAPGAETNEAAPAAVPPETNQQR
jgi:hypothetical protein